VYVWADFKRSKKRGHNMEGNKSHLAKMLMITVMGEDYREPQKKHISSLKIFWWRVKKCLFGL